MSYITSQRHCSPTPDPTPFSGVTSQHVLHHITTSVQPHHRPNPISWRNITSCLTSHHNVIAAPPQTQPHLWRNITTCLTSHHNVIAARRPNPISGVTSQHVLHHITASLQPHPRLNLMIMCIVQKCMNSPGPYWTTSAKTMSKVFWIMFPL